MWKRDSGRPARPLSHLWGSAEDDAKILDDAAGAGGGGGRGRAVVEDFGNVIDVFQRVYPTGSFGAYLHIGGLAANLAVLFVAVCVLLPGSQYRFRYVFAAIAFIPSVLEAITVLSLHPAGAARRLVRRRPSAVADVTVPIVLAAAFAFVATSRWRAAKFRWAGRKPVLHRVGCRGAIPAGAASAD
jgi:hypothetical protein